MYNYADCKSDILTDDGQRLFLRIRDWVQKNLKVAGAVRMEEILKAAGSGDSWTMLACVDRLVELGEIREITQEKVAGQHRVFVANECIVF